MSKSDRRLERTRDREWKEWERRDDRSFDRSWRDKEVRDAIDRLRREDLDRPNRGGRPEDDLTRQERLRQTDAGRQLPDFDVERARRGEDAEIRESPRAYLRRHAGEPLDAATERRIREALRRRGGDE